MLQTLATLTVVPMCLIDLFFLSLSCFFFIRFDDDGDRGENGFLHVRIDCHRIDDYSAPRDFTLATLPDRHFESVAEAVNHCANIGVYCRHLPPIILKYPLAEELV